MALSPLMPLIGIGLVVVGGMLFWAAVQNWMADLINRASEQLGSSTHALQTALVILDRVMVNGQRIFVATGRALYRLRGQNEMVAMEEVRQVRREDLPVEIREKLERGQAQMQYELSIGSMKVQNEPTYRLVVRRAE
jgi:hypothetical protein